MPSFKRRIETTLIAFGIDPGKSIRSVRGLRSYMRDRRQLKAQSALSPSSFPFGVPWPCLEDRYIESGVAKGHYFHQDLLVARRVFEHNPVKHVDIGSSVEGFVAHVASYRSIEVLDIRPLSNSVPSIRFTQADLMAPLEPALAGYCDSLSCLHALEHFGLGRYGDPVNYDGYLLGLENMHKILKSGGKFYLSVPIGPQRIEFNAHRVFSIRHLLECFGVDYRIDHFSFVDDQGDLHQHVPLNDEGIESNYGCLYGCGIFEMTKA